VSKAEKDRHDHVRGREHRFGWFRQPARATVGRAATLFRVVPADGREIVHSLHQKNEAVKFSQRAVVFVFLNDPSTVVVEDVALPIGTANNHFPTDTNTV
jgi:hypothetical protein